MDPDTLFENDQQDLAGRKKWLYLVLGAACAVVIGCLAWLLNRYGPWEFLGATQKVLVDYGVLLGWLAAAIAAVYGTRVAKSLKEADLRIKRHQLWAVQQTTRAVELQREDTPALAKGIAQSLKAELSAGHQYNSPSGYFGPSTNFESVFGQRSTHFEKEKRHLSDALLSIVRARIKCFADTKAEIVILIDAGTTLLPFFEKFGKWMVKERLDAWGDDDWWGGRVRLVTNSIAGIESLGKYGRMQRNDPYSEIACSAEIVAGQPLVVYSASVGDLAISHVLDLANRPVQGNTGGANGANGREGRHIIGLTTGNYIFVVQGVPTPIARGEGHGDIKEALCKVADEIFVVGPLGKFIVEEVPNTIHEFNSALYYVDDAKSDDRKCYAKVSIPDPEKIHALTTYRPTETSVFFKHSEHVSARLGVPDRIVLQKQVQELEDPDVHSRFEKCDMDDISHIMIAFEHPGAIENEQRILEMPHGNIRHPKVAGKFFNV